MCQRNGAGRFYRFRGGEQIPQGYGGAEKGIAVVGNGNLQPVVFLLFDYEAFRRGGEGV